jgi:PhzF family phenazine biosynthesis protein
VRLRIHHIDAFTDSVFKGNYAAVVVTDEWLPVDLMQSIAAENNFSETAFARKSVWARTPSPPVAMRECRRGFSGDEPG